MEQTTDARLIELWIKKRGGAPSIVKSTADLLRVKFDSLDTDLEEITWARFFKVLKENNLAFIYEDDDASRFCKFIHNSDTTKQ
jgi:hypothetical protein